MDYTPGATSRAMKELRQLHPEMGDSELQNTYDLCREHLQEYVIVLRDLLQKEKMSGRSFWDAF